MGLVSLLYRRYLYCVAQRLKACALGLPWRTHSALLAPVTDSLPLRDELFRQTAMFVCSEMCV